MIERKVSQGIISTYFNKLERNLDLDVAIVGGGPSGIVAAYYLAKAGLTNYFTEVTSCGTTFARKPAPAGNQYLIEKHGLDKARTLAIGDRELDVLAAKNAGIHACLFSREKKTSLAEYQICGFEELYGLLGLKKE